MKPRNLPLRDCVGKFQCARYATPTGNLWLASITMLKTGARGVAVATECDTAKTNAVARLNGPTQSELVANAVVNTYSECAKQPMLIVGANDWIKQHIPFFMPEQFDTRMFLYPNSENAWVIGTVVISRMYDGVKPLFSYASGVNSEQAALEALRNLLIQVQPDDTEEYEMQDARLTTQFLKRMSECPKITLKEVLALDSHTNELFAAEKTKAVTTRIKPIFHVIPGGKP
jgi:hypothetical protein